MDEFVEEVIPLLQERGPRTGCGETLRDHPGAAPPAPPRHDGSHHHRRLTHPPRTEDTMSSETETETETETGTGNDDGAGTASAARREAWERWRADRTETLSRPHGWLSLTGLHWLDAGPRTVDGLPGRWWADGAGVHARGLGADDLDGTGVGNWVPSESGPEVVLEFGDVHVEVLVRTGRHGLRVRDPRSPVLQAFSGVPVFGYDERFVVPARLEAYDRDREVVGGSVVEGLVNRHVAAGTVHFVLDGEPLRLTVFRSGAALSALFTDATSGVTTAPTTRSVPVGPPAADGSLVLDLNLAANYPSAFTDFATCPTPPEENRLTVAVRAGEKDPR